MANAEAWITGEYPNQKLNLKLPTGATGPVGPVGPVGPASTVPGPANTLTVVDTVTGPETPGATGPQGVKGDKGDPGGFTTPTVIGAGTSLDTVITSGLYLNPNANVANSPDNPQSAGHLEVIQSASWVLQRFTPINNPRTIYTRQRDSGSVWASWKIFTTSRVDQTAGRAIYRWDEVNAREQLVYGDTGWRDISSLLDPNFVMPAAAPRFHIRRQGYNVTLAVRIGPAAAIVGTNRNVGRKILSSFPTGFLPASNASYAPLGTGCVNIPSTSLVQLGNLSTQNELWVYGITGVWADATTDAVQVTGNWITDAAWPTTLPGTASGSIPNL